MRTFVVKVYASREGMDGIPTYAVVRIGPTGVQSLVALCDVLFHGKTEPVGLPMSQVRFWDEKGMVEFRTDVLEFTGDTAEHLEEFFYDNGWVEVPYDIPDLPEPPPGEWDGFDLIEVCADNANRINWTGETEDFSFETIVMPLSTFTGVPNE